MSETHSTQNKHNDIKFAPDVEVNVDAVNLVVQGDNGLLPSITCEKTGLNFLIDSSATRSMVSIDKVTPDRCFEIRTLAVNN